MEQSILEIVGVFLATVIDRIVTVIARVTEGVVWGLLFSMLIRVLNSRFTSAAAPIPQPNDFFSYKNHV